MIAAPIVILLLALAGANWKTFHLAYAKQLIASDDLAKQKRGVKMLAKTHLRYGMSLEEVRGRLHPAEVLHGGKPLNFVNSSGFPRYLVRLRGHRVDGVVLSFDENGRLVDPESRVAGR